LPIRCGGSLDMTARRILVGLAVIVLLLMLAALPGVLEPSHSSVSTLPTSSAAETQLPGVAEVPEGDFADADLSSGLTTICENTALNSVFSEWSEEESQERMLGVLRRLSVSPSPDHLLLAAYLETNPISQAALLERAVSIGPPEALILWAAVQFCSASSNSKSCPLQDWEQRLLAIDGSNSEIWARVAANRFSAGDHDAALEAMRRASTSSESRVYWTETIEMTERALRAASDFGFLERASHAIGVAAAHQPRYGDILTMCRTQSVKSVEWAYACLEYGQLAENQVETDMGSSIARSIQSHALEALGELESAEKVKQRSQARRQERFGSISDQRVLDLVMSNPNLFFSYLAAVKSGGEVVAQQRIKAEIERLVRQQPELICG
jgi:hypothetical protein